MIGRPALTPVLTLVLVLAGAAVSPPLGGQEGGARPAVAVVRVRDAGPGASGRIVRSALAAPHALLWGDSASRVALRRDTTYGTTVIVIGGSATVASVVSGDVIVVGGDLFLHPGAQIAGRAVAIGGGIMNSTLATVHGARLEFRDNTFAATRLGGEVVLDYVDLGTTRYPIFSLPSLYGFRLPTYERVSGLSLPFGPLVSLDTGRYEIDPVLTYRSDLGVVDPSLEARASPGRRTDVVFRAARSTLTNDAWIRSDLINSLAVLAFGRDTRNYYRADRIDVRVTRRWETATVEFDPFVAALTEQAWSVGPEPFAVSAPWSFVGRRSEEGMLRPNPAIRPGRISAAVVGGRLHWEQQEVVVGLSAQVEQPWQTPGNAAFTQATLDGDVTFPAFMNHTFELHTHAVISAGDGAPPQRFAYLGGGGTLPTLDLLAMGGDQLFYIDNRYIIPLPLTLPVVGTPRVALRYAAGSAGVGSLPRFVQNIGVRGSLSALFAEYMLDPKTRDRAVSFGVSLSR